MPYGDYYGSWRAMEELYFEGKIKSIGVCNFLQDRLIDLILNNKIIPTVNQIELHPFCQQKELCNIMEKFNIKPMGWAPFAEGKNEIFYNKTLVDIGKAYNKTPAQVILQWFNQNNIITIPKSIHIERIKENYMIDDFTLSNLDLKLIENLDFKEPLILKIQSLDEVYRLNNIKFKQ